MLDGFLQFSLQIFHRSIFKPSGSKRPFCDHNSDYRDCSTDKKVNFIVSMQENDLAKAEQEGLTKKFKLESAFTLTSMVSIIQYPFLLHVLTVTKAMFCKLCKYDTAFNDLFHLFVFYIFFIFHEY